MKDNGRRTELSTPAASHAASAAAQLFVLLVLTVACAGFGSALLRSALPSARPTAPTSTPASAAGPAVTATATPTPAARRVGIVSGHRDNDSGAVCADGFTEAELNFMHASRVAAMLQERGYTVDILSEFDARLKGYRADAYLSIHADSCQSINELATGYKVARSTHSAVPDVEDRLVQCLTQNYERATGLRFHRNTVTANMLEYHGFYKIDAGTPAAIIETGFMFLDRKVVEDRADDVARGIADGLICFLEGKP
jgi:N-acetylmuramoyl-L-alanine amidase